MILSGKPQGKLVLFAVCTEEDPVEEAEEVYNACWNMKVQKRNLHLNSCHVPSFLFNFQEYEIFTDSHWQITRKRGWGSPGWKFNIVPRIIQKGRWGTACAALPWVNGLNWSCSWRWPTWQAWDPFNEIFNLPNHTTGSSFIIPSFFCGIAMFGKSECALHKYGAKNVNCALGKPLLEHQHHHHMRHNIETKAGLGSLFLCFPFILKKWHLQCHYIFTNSTSSFFITIIITTTIITTTNITIL